jgi:diguanylate cyclase (GGDEF)-like protein/PAS domain S-box-containing protein
VLKVKIYSPSGRTVFSTDERQIGEDKADNAGFRRAISGIPASELTHRNRFSAFEQTVENIDVISTYVPVVRDSGGQPVGVFEIYSDTSALVERIAQTRATVALQVTAVLVGLYLLLFLIVWRADRLIRRQELRRTRDERRLQAARQEIDRSEQFHRALIEHSSDAVLLLGRDRRVSYAAPADSRVLGVEEEDLPGLLLADYAVPECRIPVEDWLRRVETGEGETRDIEFEGVHALSGRRHFVATATNLHGHPAVRGIVVNIRDFTERKQAELQVRRHALFDDLTGLARREYFVQQLNAAVAQASRRAEMLAVMFMDLDGFKQVNDTLGHEAGDQLLKAVAGRMRAILREEDAISRVGTSPEDIRIARLGGDEFTVLLTGLNDPDDAEGVAWRLLATVAAPYSIDGSKVRVTASIGIAIFPNAGTTGSELLRNADAAMYAAK